jgi:hypothetical protein
VSLSSPPVAPIPWAAKTTDGRTEVFTARTWFQARKQAMAHFGCGPEAVALTPQAAIDLRGTTGGTE